jgi:Spy/CpxP family protein refolding chaperone
VQTSKQTVSLTLILLSFLIASCAPYPYVPRRVMADPLYGAELYSKALDLHDDQLRAISKLRGDLRKEQIKGQAEIETAMLDLQELTSHPKKDLDEATILKKVEEIGSIETNLRKKTVQTRLSLSKVLTDEQYEKLLDILDGEVPY